MAKMSMSRFNSMVRAAVQTPHRSRVRMDVSLTGSTLSEKNLLIVDDDPDYDLATDGSNVAEAEALSRLRSIRLRVSYFAGTSNAAGALVEWILFRNPDNLLTSVNPSKLFQADIDATSALLRKNALAYGGFYSSANNDTHLFDVRIRRAAIKRIQRLSDGDNLEFNIITPATGAKYFMTGTITWAK